MPSKDKLAEFVAWCAKHITGDEKGQAQIFLDRLFQAFGQPGCLDVGGATEFRIRKADEDGGGTAFADYVWKPVVLIEMKKRGENLQKHYRQAFDYWTRLVPHRPRYVVLCNFDEFRVYDFDTDLDTPKDTLRLTDLPDRWGPLAFLCGLKPSFESDREAVTREAADKLAFLFNRLLWREVERGLAQRFILQTLVALFAEDIGLLEKYFVARLLEDCDHGADAYDLLGGLFEAMNTETPARGGRFKGVAYFNGGLFAHPARLELQDTELVLLREAAKSDWSKVQPEIFGTLFQHSMGKQERHAFGAEFTHPSDIMKIVGPTIVQPWREQIEGAKTLKRLRELLQRMHHYRVLDPACGCGNFLYLSYRELKRLEARIYERMAEFSRAAEPGQMRLSFVSAQNFFGLDIQPFAVEIAKVTMMIARKLAIDELHITEKALPLDNLDNNFIAADALLTPEGLPAQWPQADVIIGNPPFLGAKKLKPERGVDYVNTLRRAYAEVPGMADYCVYWIRKAHEHLQPCSATDPVAGRAGLVGTNNIRNIYSRIGGLDHVAKTGTIVEAVENQPWSGEANVHVSIVNWVKTQDAALLPKTRKLWFKVEPSKSAKKPRERGSGPAAKRYELDCRECERINSALSDQTDVSLAKSLDCNTEPQRCFNGQMIGHENMLLSEEQRAAITSKDPKSAEVIFPYLNGVDALTELSLDRYVIDFEQRNQFDAASYPGAFDWVKTHVLPDRERKAKEGIDKDGKMRPHHKAFLARWWQLSFGRPEMLSVIKPLPRFLACSYVTQRPIFMFVSSAIRPSNLIQIFGFSDDYSFGVMQSHAHWLWFVTKCGKLGVGFRYSAESVFDTFPWPQFDVSPSAARRDIVVESAAQKRRSSVGATSSDDAAPDGAKSKSTTASYKEVAPTGAEFESTIAGYQDAAPAGAATPNAVLSRDAIAKIDAVAAAARELRRVRAEALPKMKGGLRALYRTLELPGANPLKDAHAALDTAVLAAYGFSAKKDLLAQLLALNQQVAAKIEKGEQVVAPGVPKNYPDAKKLVTADCIKPSVIP